LSPIISQITGYYCDICNGGPYETLEEAVRHEDSCDNTQDAAQANDDTLANENLVDEDAAQDDDNTVSSEENEWQDNESERDNDGVTDERWNNITRCHCVTTTATGNKEGPLLRPHLKREDAVCDDEGNIEVACCVCYTAHPPETIRQICIGCDTCGLFYNAAVDCLGFEEAPSNWSCWACAPPVQGMGL